MDDRDDGLACFENISGPQADQIRKDFIKIFRKEFQLSIVCETNLSEYSRCNVRFSSW